MDGDVDPLPPPRLLALTFGVGTLVGLLAVVLYVVVLDRDGDSSPQATGRSVAAESEPRSSAGPAPGQLVADTRTERCSDAAEALAAPLEAARPALRQWDVHVEAMNQLVVGEITLQQATQFWEETRLGAQRNVERFRTAWNELKRSGVDCPMPGLMGPAPAEARSCARLMEAELAVARAARTSVDTWDMHVQHMDMLRMGTLSPEKGTEMWLSMWRRGVRDLDTYREATRDPALEVDCR